MPRAVFLLAALGVAAMAVPLWASPAPAPSGVRADVRVGFDGYVVPEVWIPVVIRLQSPRDIDGTVEVLTTRSRPPTTERVQVEVHLSAGAPLQIVVPAVVHDLHAPVSVQVRENGIILGEWAVPVPPARLVDGVILALTRQPVGLQRVLGEDSRLRVAYMAEEDLPARWQEYEGVASLVVQDLDDHRLLPAQVQALSGWLATGGRLLVAAGGRDLTHSALRPLITSSAGTPHVPGGPERAHRWGRGEIVTVPTDPFRPGLSADESAVWARLLRDPRPVPLADRALLDVLPETAGVGLGVQVLIVLALGGYLVLLRPLVHSLQRGRVGIALAIVVLAAMTLFTAMLNMAVRRSTSGVITAAVALGLPDQRLALVESAARVLPPRSGHARIRAPGDALIRAVPAAETVLVLIPETRLEGRSDGPLSLRATSLASLPIRGLYRERAEGIEVDIRNGTGRRLRDPVVVLAGRYQAAPPIGQETQFTLTPLGWRDDAGSESARGTPARLRAWAFSRLRTDAILSATASLVAWLDDDRGTLSWPDQPATPLLLVLPLSRAEGPP